MRQRVTKKMLENVIERINELTDSPMEYSTVNKDGKRVINIGHYTLSGAYGGWNLERVENDAGAVSCPLGNYHRPARELYDQLFAFIAGIKS